MTFKAIYDVYDRYMTFKVEKCTSGKLRHLSFGLIYIYFISLANRASPI